MPIRGVTLLEIAPLLTKGAERTLSIRQRRIVCTITLLFWKYLAMQDRLRGAGLIFVFGSSSERPPAHAADLFKRGYAPKILVSGGTGGRGSKPGSPISEARIYADILIRAGVPPEVILLEEESKNTGANVSKGFAVLNRAGLSPRDIILVTRPVLQRRAWATAVKQFPEVTYLNSPAKESLSVVSDTELLRYFAMSFGEIDRLLRYPAQGFVTAQNISEPVLRRFREARDQIFGRVEIDPELLTV